MTPDVRTAAEGFKAVDSDVLAAITQSVQTPEDMRRTTGPIAADRYGVLWFAAGYSNAIPDWGTAPTNRDAELGKFITIEPYAAAAFGAIAERNAVFTWELEGGELVRDACFKLLNGANWGSGWIDFITKLTWDMLTQDKGAFVEIVRAADSPDAPVIAIKTLQACYCWSTGDPAFPVMFLDRRSGKWHRMAWYQVYHIAELPVHHPLFAGLQISALTRVLRGAQIMNNVSIYEDEKTGGRHTREINIVNGVTKNDLSDAMALQQQQATDRGQSRYIQPVVIAGVSSEKPASVAVVKLASLPDGWDAEKQLRTYFTLLALALGTDYGELAPLPGRGIGTAAQSSTMDAKSRLKSAGLFKKVITEMMNTAILPTGCSFGYKEQDLGEELLQAQVGMARAQERGAMILNGEIDPVASRQLALETGDLTEEMVAAMGERDLIEDSIRENERQVIVAAGGSLPPQPTTAPRSTQGQVGGGGGGTSPKGQSPTGEGSATKDVAGPSAERLQAEAAAARVVHSALSTVMGNVATALGVTDRKEIARESEDRIIVIEKQILRDEQGRIVGVKEVHKEVTPA